MSRKEEPVPQPSANTKPANYQEMFDGRHVVTKFIDPCETLSRDAQECMMRSNNRDDCLAFFQAYRDCKAEWLEDKRTRRFGRAKIPPPPPKPEVQADEGTKTASR